MWRFMNLCKIKETNPANRTNKVLCMCVCVGGGGGGGGG